MATVQDSNPDANFDAWNEARNIGKLVANVSALFSTAIRFLKKDAEAGLKTISPSTRFCLQRLMNSPSVKAPVYYAALCFKPEALEGQAHVSCDMLMNVFTPDEMASLLGLLYLYRRIQKAADPTEWQGLSNLIHLNGELGGHLGRAIPNIGLGWGLLAGSMRHFAFGLFLISQQKAFIQYRRHLKIQGLPFDFAEEEKHWHCNHVQVASFFTQALALGGNASNALVKGLMLSTLSEKDLDRDSYRMRITWTWINALKETGAPPQMTHRGDFYPLRQELDRLVQCAAAIRKNGPKVPFFAKGKDDISPQLTPCLFLPTEAVETLPDAESEAEIMGDVPAEEAKPSEG